MDELVTITASRHDIEVAINDVGASHAERCLSSDNCECWDVQQRLQAALNTREQPMKEHAVRAVIADSITIEIEGTDPGVVVLEDGTEIVIPPGRKITFWKQPLWEANKADVAPSLDLQDVYDEMTDEMKAAAEQGFIENPVAQHYAQSQAMPHSRACGIRPHDHGIFCHDNCPTCHGKEMP